MKTDTVSLIPFQAHNANSILSWIESPEELWQWATRKDFPLTDTDVFRIWHADPDVKPYEFLADGEVLGYGELWCESEEPWAELARLIIAPAHRNRGFGKLLVGNLVKRIRQLGFADVWVRVYPTNDSAIACYQKAGFIRVSESREEDLNADQRHGFIWMQMILDTPT
jgi:ribosomal protein S18 acetylase RimI-like enzyme